MKSSTRPMMVTAIGQPTQTCMALEGLELRKSTSSSQYDEKWIQKLIDRHPAVLPIADIEPGLEGALSICCELPTPSGFIDNLLITREGGIVIVEAKLWRNPEARRKVIGQILDYAKDLNRWTYEDLERAVGRALGRTASLTEMVLKASENTEAASFIDAVSRNLRLGRFLCMIVGDGIQESAEQLADFIQQHVGLHFTLSMVELSLWRLPSGADVFVQPRVILRTVQIERPVIRLNDEIRRDYAQSVASTGRQTKVVSISEEQFYERLEKVGSDLPSRLASFLSSLEDEGIWSDIKKGMSLKWTAPSGSDFTLAALD